MPTTDEDHERPPRARRPLRPAVAGLIVAVLAAFGLVLPTASASADTLTPTADSYVDASRPTSNFGTKTPLRADGSPVVRSYMKFDAASARGSASAQLRLYAETGSPVGIDVSSAADTTWAESTISDANAPPTGGLIASTGEVVGGHWYTIDVSPAFAADPDGVVTFVLSTSHTTAVRLPSREGANPPELVVSAAPPPQLTDFLVTVAPAGGYRADSNTGMVFAGSVKSVVESAVIQLRAEGGGTIEFGPGTFDLGTESLELRDLVDVTFRGQGVDLTVLRNNVSNGYVDSDLFDIWGAVGVVISDLTVEAGGSPRSTSDAISFHNANRSVIERIRIAASRGRGIILDGKNTVLATTDNVVRDCVITGVPGDGIEFLAASGNRIENCTITNVGGHGIQLIRSSTRAMQPHRKSNGNTVTANTVASSGKDGINVHSSDGNMIVSNVVTNSSRLVSGGGIRITSSDSLCDDNRVEANTSTNIGSYRTQRFGLFITSSSCNRTVVRSNNFDGNFIGPISDRGTGTIYL